MAKTWQRELSRTHTTANLGRCLEDDRLHARLCASNGCGKAIGA